MLEPLEGRLLLSRAGLVAAAPALSNLSTQSGASLTKTTGAVSRPAVQLAAAGSNLTVSSALSAPGFQIEVDFPDNSLTATQQAAFTTAAAKWESIITGDLPDVAASPSQWGAAVDDVRITATAIAIDGVGGTLGQAGPQYVRSGLTGANAQYNGLPISGMMQFDSADLTNLESTGQLVQTITHEMGHVLGFGTLWASKGLITGAGGADPQCTGANAVAQYNALFGTGGDCVPLENTGGSATRDSHWREATFNNELMTGFLNSGSNPLSRVTAASMMDIGYPGVVLSAADAYTPPANAVPQVGSLTDGADPVAVGTTVNLTANAIANSPSGEAVTVKFYRESNGVPGLQTVANGGIQPDTLIVADAASPYTASVPTTGLSPGTYTYYAQPTDAAGLTGNAVSTTNTVQAVSATPGTPDLMAATDTGVSNTDNVTSRNNANAGRTLQLSVPNPVAGATVTVYADGVAVGSGIASGATTIVTTNGTAALADGTHSFTARQAESGKYQSADSTALGVTIDTAAPTVALAAITPNPRGTPVSSVSITFTEAVSGFDLSDLTLTRDSGANLLPSSTAALSTADSGVTWSLTGLTSLTTVPGNYALSLAAANSGIADTAGNALSAGAAGTFTVLPAVAVQSVQVNDGSAQRSRVTSLTVTFNEPVTLGTGAITVMGRNGAGAGMATNVANPSGDGRTYVLTFTGTPVVAGSLADGIYDLVIHASLVSGAGGAAMATDSTSTFHRLFGDIDGNKTVNALDYARFKQAFGSASGSAGYDASLDFDGNGAINALDYAQFKNRFGLMLNY